jgi:hypothetical protein
MTLYLKSNLKSTKSFLLSNPKALVSSPSTTKKKKKKRFVPNLVKNIELKARSQVAKLIPFRMQ